MNSSRVTQLHSVHCPHLSFFLIRKAPVSVLLRGWTNISSYSIRLHSRLSHVRPNLPLKCASMDSWEPDKLLIHSSDPTQMVNQNSMSLGDILKQSNSLLPYVALTSTLLALISPQSFTWFTTSYYAPALGFLMFAVGFNSSEKDFLEAFKRPAEIFTGYVGQFVVKPIIGYSLCVISVTVFGLPAPIGIGMVLLACVSGAQLSSYATFLSDPQMAPLSIVMTSLSTVSAVFVTPLLLLFLIGKKLPIDVKGMVFSITQIVLVPITYGLLLNRFFPYICNAIRPILPPLSVLVVALSAGAPIATNIESVKTPFGVAILVVVVTFHLLCFIVGYVLSGFIFRDTPDSKALQRTISFEIGPNFNNSHPCSAVELYFSDLFVNAMAGMQSSLLALALANKFFEDPAVAMPPAISSPIMSLMGFSLVLIWSKTKRGKE